MKTFKLTLVRHGQTTYNVRKIIQGQLDTELTELGCQQAQLLSDYIEKHALKFDTVYSSDLRRAYETCQTICNDKYEIIKSELLRERSFGVLQGSPLELLRSEAYKTGLDASNFTQFCPEGGEALEEVQERIKNFCKKQLFLQSKEGERVLIVSHGGVIREFMKLFKKFGCPLANSDLRVAPNTSMNDFEIRLNEDNRIVQVIPIALHQIPHLTSEAKSEALNEEQLNESSCGKDNEVEHAV